MSALTEKEKEAIRARLRELGVDAPLAAGMACAAGERIKDNGINIQTLFLYGLTVVDGCRLGLDAALVAEIEDLHRKVNEETDRMMAEDRN